MSNTTEKNILRRLDDNPVLRRAVPADAERLAEFNAHIHSDDGPNNPIAISLPGPRSAENRTHV
jgi:hypothetical protein